MKIKIIKTEKEDKTDPLEWKLRMEEISMKDRGVDQYFEKAKLDEIKEE